MREVDYVIAKGKGEPVTIYEVLDGERDERREAKLRTREAFGAAVTSYREARWDDALAGFGDVLDADAEDTAAVLYLERVSDALQDPPVVWDGITRLDSK